MLDCCTLAARGFVDPPIHQQLQQLASVDVVELSASAFTKGAMVPQYAIRALRIYLRSMRQSCISLSDDGGEMTHYETLRVLPSAEHAVVRAAYRSLMRLYHPDSNDSAEAQVRVREITAAFAVVGDPSKRAIYDAERFLDDNNGVSHWFGSDHPPPFRNLGIALIALALAISLTAPLWLKSNESARRERRSSQSSAAMQMTSASQLVALLRQTDLPDRKQTGSPAPQLTLSGAGPKLTQAGSSRRSIGRSVMRRETTRDPVLSTGPGLVAVPTPASRMVAMSKSGTSNESSVKRAAVAETAVSAPIVCTGTSPNTGIDPCTVDRKAEIQRVASGFLNQSIAHSGWQQQELLFSVRDRAALSRAVCRSDECVIGTYMRQLRETTQIMESTPRP